MAIYNPEEIAEMADKLMRDIAENTKDIASEKSIDTKMVLNYIDRCSQIVKNLAESMSELHQRVDVLTEKDK